MPITTKPFSNEKAPCGQLTDGERLQDRDEDCLLSDKMFYECGCKTIRHEYHDGSVSNRIIHHDGTVLKDRLNTE